MKASDLSRPKPRLMNKWHTCQKWQAKIYPWHAAFTTLPIVSISLADQSQYCEEYAYMYVCTYERTHTYIHTHCVATVCGY
jgi:hypothetical protein